MILEKECLHSEIPTGTQQQEDDKVSRGVGSGEESMVSVPDAAAERWVTVKGKCLQGKPARERGRTPPNPILNRSLPELASSLLTTGSSGTRPPLECKYFPVFPRMSWELEALASDFRACQFVFRAQEGLLGGWDMGLTCGYYPAGLRECCAQHPPPRWGGGVQFLQMGLVCAGNARSNWSSNRAAAEPMPRCAGAACPAPWHLYGG